jgi:hypothetical protein
MNNKYNFDVILKHSKMQYKKGPHTYALMLVNGEWITSTKSNDEAHRLLIAQIKHKEYQADKKLGIHIPKRLPNKTSAMTYMQTVDAQKLLDSGACSMYRLSKTISVDPRAIKRCIKFLINFGEEGFYEYG